MTTQFDFDEPVDRFGTQSIKWEKYRGRDILPMWVADSDFRVAPAIREAMDRRLEHGVFGYTHASPRLVELVVERLQRLYGWRIHPEWLVWLPGVVSGLHTAVRGNSAPGDPVYFPDVVYHYIRNVADLCERAEAPVPMCWRDDRLLIDLDWLDARSGPAGRILLFCNPQNPGGTVYRESELRRLADIAIRHELLVVSDEIHCDLVLDDDRRHIPVAALGPEIEQRTVTLMSCSKSFNIAGLNCGFAVVPNRKIRAALQRARSGIVPYASALGFVATEAAYEHGDEWNRQQCAYLAASRDYLIDAINRIPGLWLGSVEATYLAWIRVAELELDDPIGFFEDAGVGLSPGSQFGDPGYMRLNFGCPRGRVEAAVDRIRRAVEARG